jgi:replicative DNA helicase
MIEEQILGSALTNKRNLQELCKYPVEMFLNDFHRKIASGMIELLHTGTEVDSGVLCEHINCDPYQLVNITTAFTVNFDHLAGKLYKKYIDRRVAHLAEQIMHDVKNGDDYTGRISDLNKIIDESVREDNTTFDEYHEQSIEEIIEPSRYIKLGISSLDEKVQVRKGQVIVIAGSPGCGKSTLAFQILCNSHNNAMISLEMTKDELYIKLLSRFASVDSVDIERCDLSQNDLAKIASAKEKIKREIVIDVFSKVYTFQEIIAIIRSQARKGDCKCIAIDYLQLVSGGTGDTQTQRIESITSQLKLVAKQEDVAIILLSQITKESYKEPSLQGLRGSGSIGQDADLVLFLHEGSLIVAKGRMCRVGEVKGLNFQKEFSRFVEAEPSWNNAVEI